VNLKQLLKNAGIRNDIIKEVERKAKKSSEQMEEEHREKAMAMTKMMLNDALRYRKEHAQPEKPPFEKKIIIPD
jgi:hypothetical protein